MAQTVLAIAFAYDICSGADPCKVNFDHKSIRQHLAKCLEKCILSRFPIVGERRSTGVKRTQTVDLHCSCHMPEERGDGMAECDLSGTTDTAWTFLVKCLVSHGNVKYVPVCECMTPASCFASYVCRI